MAPIDDIARVISEAIAKALKESEDEFIRVAKAGGKEAGPGLFQDVGSVVGIITDVILALPIVGDIAGAIFDPVKTIEHAAGGSGRAFGMGWVLGSIGVELLQPAVLDIQHYVNDLLQTEIFDPNTAALLRAKGIITEDQGRSEAAGGNLDGSHFDKLVDSAQERPAIGQVLDAWNKDLVDEQAVDAALQHHAIPQFWWGPLKALRRSFLSPADLALANLRGNIDDTTMEGYARQLGVDANDMAVLVENTGEPPGIMEMLFLYRRGLVDKDRLTRAIRQSRIRNEWVDAVIDLRFQPMTTSDAARAVVENYMSMEDGAKIAEENGLEPAHWPFIVESWGRPPSHEQMMNLYHRGQATREEVNQAARESNIKDKYIGKLFDLGRVLISERMIVSALAHGAVSHDDAHKMLLEHGYNDDDAETLIKLGGAQRLSSQHALTRTDILAMYTDRLLTKNDAEGHLTKLGYTPADAASLLNLADVKAESSAKRSIMRAIEASLKAHHLTHQAAINQLEAAGVDNAQARALVDEWTQQRGATTRLLTEAQTVSAAAAQLISPTECFRRLGALGYAAGDAVILMELKGIPTGPGFTETGAAFTPNP